MPKESIVVNIEFDANAAIDHYIKHDVKPKHYNQADFEGNFFSVSFLGELSVDSYCRMVNHTLPDDHKDDRHIMTDWNFELPEPLGKRIARWQRLPSWCETPDQFENHPETRQDIKVYVIDASKPAMQEALDKYRSKYEVASLSVMVLNTANGEADFSYYYDVAMAQGYYVLEVDCNCKLYLNALQLLIERLWLYLNSKPIDEPNDEPKDGKKQDNTTN